MRRVYIHIFIVFAVVVKAFPQTPALDSDSILFLENRSCLGLVSGILSNSKLIILKALNQNLKKNQPGFKSRPCQPSGLVGKNSRPLCLFMVPLTMKT